MKLGFSTIGCPQWDWAEILGTAKDMGIDGLEIRGVEDEIDPMKITIFDAEHLEKTRTQLAQAGIEIAMIASSVVLGDPMGSREGEQQMVQAKNQIDFASQNGIPFVRVLLTLDPNPVPADLPAAKERYEQLCSYVANKNVRVLVESCGLLSDSAKLATFIADACPESRGVLWDIQHPFRNCAEKPKQTVANLGKEIRYVQVKDSVVDDNGEIEYRMMGLGDVPVYDAVKQLYQMGYEGYLTLEWLKRWRPKLRDPDVIFYHFQTYMETLLAEIENEERM